MTTDIDIRPAGLNEFAGQPDLKRGLEILLGSAKQRGSAPDHLLFYGPPGLGKTTLARIVANEMGTKITIVTGPAIESPSDLTEILLKVGRGEVLFIDEIHRLPMVVEEVLYSAMEDFRLDVTLGKGDEAVVVGIPLPEFALIGATTRLGDLSNPLRDRFGQTFRLDYYDDETLARIAERTARVLGMLISPVAALALARRARGTPRIVNRLVRRSRDYSIMGPRRDGAITSEDVAGTLELLGIDGLGLDAMDRRLLTALATQYEGGPVGLNTMAVLVSEPINTVADAMEPFLMRLGLLKRTERGRMLTAEGWDYIRKEEVQ